MAAEQWDVLAAFVAGGGFWKAAEHALKWWRGRLQASVEQRRLELQADREQEAVGVALREELRGEVRRLAREVETLRGDVERIRAAYWAVVEEREALKVQNRALLVQVETLRTELLGVQRRNGALEARVAELEERCRRCAVLQGGALLRLETGPAGDEPPEGA